MKQSWEHNKVATRIAQMIHVFNTWQLFAWHLQQQLGAQRHIRLLEQPQAQNHHIDGSDCCEHPEHLAFHGQQNSDSEPGGNHHEKRIDDVVGRHHPRAAFLGRKSLHGGVQGNAVQTHANTNQYKKSEHGQVVQLAKKFDHGLLIRIGLIGHQNTMQQYPGQNHHDQAPQYQTHFDTLSRPFFAQKCANTQPNGKREKQNSGHTRAGIEQGFRQERELG